MLLESTLYKALQSHTDSHLIIAYSGGIDSQVLLHALSKLKNNSLNSSQQNAYQIHNAISVCHVNHGYSKNAKQWEVFAQQQCDLRQTPLDICRVNVKAKAQHSLEELFRDARYDAIKTLITEKKINNAVVLTGHHSDDQAETFLLALKRGSGLKGLSAMKQTMLFGQAQLVRPLLSISQNEIEAYAQNHQLSWIDDESNDDVRFDRNFIRHNVMPTITKNWSSFLKTINRSVEHCQEAELLLIELAQQDLTYIQTTEKCLSLTKLQVLSQARFNNVVRYFLSSQNCLMPSTAQLVQLQIQLLADSDKNPAVKVGEYWLRRFKKSVYLTSEFQDISNINLIVGMKPNTLKEENIVLPDGLGKLIITDKSEHKVKDEGKVKGGTEKSHVNRILAPLSNQAVTIRFTHNNPTCTPDYRQHSRALKKVLQELDIPPWQRKRLPFLYYNEQLVAVLGHFVCKEFVPAGTDEALYVNWVDKK